MACNRGCCGARELHLFGAVFILILLSEIITVIEEVRMKVVCINESGLT